MKTVLIVEDDRISRMFIKESLDDETFLLLEAANGQRMMEIISRYKVDLILLDLHLPDGKSEDMIPDVRKMTDVPIIMLSGNSENIHKILCLDRGADDYITKPFEKDELNARIRASLRRYGSNNNEIKSKFCTFFHWTLDPARFDAFDNEDRPAELTMQEFNLLNTLAQNIGKVISREDLCKSIKQEGYVPTPRAIDVKITRLRKKLGDNSTTSNMIKTVRGAGYMLCTG